MSKSKTVLENVRFNQYAGAQDSEERTFLGYLNCEVVVEGAIPGADFVLDLRDLRLTYFHGENAGLAVSFPSTTWKKGTEERRKSLVRADDATYEFLRKQISELRVVKRAIQSATS